MKFKLRDAKGRLRTIEVVFSVDLETVRRWEDNWLAQGDRGEASHWHWPSVIRRKMDQRGFTFFALVEGRNCHGMAMMLFPYPSKAHQGREVAYLDRLEVAPRNRAGNPDRDLTGVGEAALVVAQRVGFAAGYGFALGLHSLGGAVGFYERLGMTAYGRDPRCENLPYFETWDMIAP